MENELRKDFVVEIEGITYKIRNIPYVELDAEGDEFIDIGVALKLTMIRDLMYANEIPHDVDFTDVEDLKL